MRAFEQALRLAMRGGLSRRAAAAVGDALARVAADDAAADLKPAFDARLRSVAAADPEGLLRRLAGFQFWIDLPSWPDTLRARLCAAALAADDADSALFGSVFAETPQRKAEMLNAAFARRGIGGTVTAGGDAVPYVFAPAAGPVHDGPLVTVVMTAFDAEATLPAALASVLGQSWRALEIIIVDDASRDGTWAAIRTAAARDRRVHGIRLAGNGGTYRAKTIGLNRASGRFLTFHDADDVSHPEKVARQVAVLADPSRRGSMSRWIRVGMDGGCAASFAGNFVWRNKSSLMIRREVLDRIGPFDRVRVSADSEFHERILAVYGPAAVAEIDEPLSLGTVRPESLTQSRHTRMTHTFVAPVRVTYEAAYRTWHAGTPPARLVMPQGPGVRPFPAPPEILSGATDDAIAETT